MPSEARHLPDNLDSALRWLDHGVELAQARRGDRAVHTDVIWCLVEEAVDIMDRMPDRELGWMKIGSTSAGFGGLGLSREELLAIEQMRYLSNMKPYDGSSGLVLDRTQAQRAFDILLWLRWCGVHVRTESPELMRKAAIALARGGDAQVFHRVWRPGRKVRHQAAGEFRTVFGGHVLAGLRIDLGIVPCAGLRFARLYPEGEQLAS